MSLTGQRLADNTLFSHPPSILRAHILIASYLTAHSGQLGFCDAQNDRRTAKTTNAWQKQTATEFKCPAPHR